MEKHAYNYNELCEAQKNNKLVIDMAIRTILSYGTLNLQDATVKAQGNLLAGELKKEYEECVGRLAMTPITTILGFIQREMPPVEDRSGKELPPLHPFGDQEGVCPVCGGELEYDGTEYDDDGGVHLWTCTDCGATGREGYSETFDRHYSVKDADGNMIPGRAECDEDVGCRP